ncbi:MAG TPA: MASE1 domain-containing protein [Burkholderiales bacterium]|jgi:signal transduction histidine kinase
MRTPLVAAAYVAAYVLLDWVSYIHPLGPFAITPWNPPPGLSVALLMAYGLRLWPALLVAGIAAEVVVRGWPASPVLAVAATALIAAGYTATAALLRRRVRATPDLETVGGIAWFVGVVSIASLAVAALYVATYVLAGHMAWADVLRSMVHFWVGDAIGILVTSPFVLHLLAHRGRAAHTPAQRMELAAQAAAVVAALWLVFGIGGGNAAKFFYVLFLPLIWISVRHGARGASFALVALQLGIVAALQIRGSTMATVLEFQLFTAALAVTGLFLGAVVSERRRTGDALAAREEELARSLRLAAAAETASSLAHELNQPLSAIGSYVRACSLMMERPDEHRERLAQTMNTVVAEVNRAGEVVRRLREFFRSGTSRLERAGVAALIESGVRPLEQRLARHRIALRVDIAPGLPEVTVDRLQIETVLHNLVANAVDAIAAAAAPERSVAIRALRAGTAVQITVADSGPGLPAGMNEQVFRPFATTKPNGMGLGLAISRSIVENHGGRLVVEGVERGAAFSFTLPLEPAREAAV